MHSTPSLPLNLSNPQHPERMIAIKRILGAYNLDQIIKTEDVALMLDRFASQLDKLFQPKTILVETPFLSVNSHGQRTSGYIDLLLETSKGTVIIDHKSFLGKEGRLAGQSALLFRPASGLSRCPP